MKIVCINFPWFPFSCWNQGTCFLFCVLESACTAPTYLRICEVPKEVRMEYYNYYRENGQPKPLELYWWEYDTQYFEKNSAF